jgi:hypothetical protein
MINSVDQLRKKNNHLLGFLQNEICTFEITIFCVSEALKIEVNSQR